MANLMKDYVRRQLRYWVDGFTDDLLPRDFMSKGFTRTQLMLPDIRLKPQRVAAVLQLPLPLLVTQAQCVELSIAVPSWTEQDKKEPARPVLIHMNELLVEVRNIGECNAKVRREVEERVQAMLLEPDPLGSTAAMLEFAREVVERTRLVIDKLSVQVFVGGVSRLEFMLVDLHARTTDALWQDAVDPTTCIDYSPDHLVQTRFKCASFTLSVAVSPASLSGAGAANKPTISVLSKVSVVIRVTRFYHRQELEDAWTRHLQLVDVNLGVLKMEYNVTDAIEMYAVLSTLCNWILNGSCLESDESSVDGMSSDREVSSQRPQDTIRSSEASIKLQITFRGTIEAKLTFNSVATGPQELFLVIDRAAGSIIVHRHGSRELQLSLHDLSVRFRGYVILRLKPDREVFRFEQRRQSICVKCRMQSIMCRLDDDLSTLICEVHKFISEKEEPIVLRCGTCHQKISLEMIDVHVCPPRHHMSSPLTPSAHRDSRRSSFCEGSNTDNGMMDPRIASSTNGKCKIHFVVQMDELELQAGSLVIQHIIQRYTGLAVTHRETTIKVSAFRLTTESNEFGGDAIFVPALPLAFQMLECTLQGCDCILNRKGNTREKFSHDTQHTYYWPARVFLDIEKCSITSDECFLHVEKVQLRSSYSDGSRVCLSSQPQLSFHANVDKIRCRLDDMIFQLARKIFDHVGGYLSSPKGSTIMALFLGVLQIRVLEFTLQANVSVEARAKSLLKQAIIVFDNQLGFLCTQSSLDFKTVLNSQLLCFRHRSTPAPCHHKESETMQLNPENKDASLQNLSVETENSTSDQPLPEKEEELDDTLAVETENILEHQVHPVEIADVTASAPTERIQLEREDACRCIQRMARRRQLVRQHKQRFQVDDFEPGVIKPMQTHSQPPASIHLRHIVGVDDPPLTPRRRNLGVPSPITVLSGDNDLVGDIRGGITKLISPLNRTLLQKESIRGGFNKLMAPINRTIAPTENKRKQSIESTLPAVEIACFNVTPSNDRVVDDLNGAQKRNEVRQGKVYHVKGQSQENIRETIIVSDGSSGKQEKITGPLKNTVEAKEKVPSAGVLAGLPDVVRALVQIRECRLCIPVNPRENVELLCQEIVRRFNESFGADGGEIQAVSLQDKHGGVFSPSDTVGLILSVAPSELLFAYPLEHDGQVRSLVRVATGLLKSGPVKAALQKGDKGDAEEVTTYSKLPLPLAIALLANESERDLIRSGICRAKGEEWPDLALNAASLDAETNPLCVEVAWHETCIEVTNGDAFALCRQMLGLCTLRMHNKYVGKILRQRLKIDSSNPLVAWACRRKRATDLDTVEDTEKSAEDVVVSYQELKKVVQDKFGTYSR